MMRRKKRDPWLCCEKPDPWTNFGRWMLTPNVQAGVCCRCGQIIHLWQGRVYVMAPDYLMGLYHAQRWMYQELIAEQRGVRLSMVPPNWRVLPPSVRRKFGLDTRKLEACAR